MLWVNRTAIKVNVPAECWIQEDTKKNVKSNGEWTGK